MPGQKSPPIMAVFKRPARGVTCPVNAAILELMNVVNDQKRSPSREILTDWVVRFGMGGSL
jgi:hypothetical protein